MREIVTHRYTAEGGSDLNDMLKVVAVDPPGIGGGNHVYHVFADESRITMPDGKTVNTAIKFQDGSVNEAGINGISNEALLAIVADRLNGFQSGKFACDENRKALSNVNEALLWLGRRTATRIMRGVEGTTTV